LTLHVHISSGGMNNKPVGVFSSEPSSETFKILPRFLPVCPYFVLYYHYYYYYCRRLLFDTTAVQLIQHCQKQDRTKKLPLYFLSQAYARVVRVVVPAWLQESTIKPLLKNALNTAEFILLSLLYLCCV
jgi:hypothetical protein